jgi:hypothetical protein
VHVVGGRVRDTLLGRRTDDTDLLVRAGAVNAARRLADRTGGRCVVLDDERDVARLIWPGRPATLDVAAWGAATLEGDLRLRDFTVNAMCVPLDLEIAPGTILDPAGGLSDLADRRLRIVSERSLRDDPLRLLRGVRLAVELGFVIAPETAGAMRANAYRVVEPSGERLRDELFRVFRHPESSAGVRLLDDLDLLAPLGLTLDRGYRSDWTGLVPQVADHVARQLAQEVAGGRSRRELLALAALVADSGSAELDALTERLKLARAERRMLADMWSARGLWPAAVASGGRGAAAYRLFSAAGAAGVEAVLLELSRCAEAVGIPGAETSDSRNALELDHAAAAVALLEAWFEEPETVLPHGYLDGADIVATFGLLPGPAVGAVLDAVREAAADGLVTDRRSALEVAERALAAMEE